MKHIYHYTSYEKGMSILRSGTLRMYNIRSQSDEYEAVYMGNQLCNVLLKYFTLKHENYSYQVVQGLGACMLFVAKYLSNHVTADEIIRQVSVNVDTDNFFCRLLEHFSERENKTFICSFSTSFQNSFLWQEYADNQGGVVFEFSTENLEKATNREIGYRQVEYRNSDIIVRSLINFVKKHTASCQTIEDVIKEIIGKKIQEVFSTKEPQYSKENEVRLLANYDSQNPIHKIIEDNGREYIIYPEKGDAFYRRIKKIYVKRLIQDNDRYKELLEICKKNSIIIKKI